MIKSPKLIAVLLLLLSNAVFSEEFQFVDSTFCPLVCNPKVDGKEGFIIDILRDALATKKHTIKFTIVPYKRALSMVRSGQAHALPAIYQADAPDLIVGNSVIALGKNHFFVRADSDWKYTSKGSWDEVSLGVVDGYTYSHHKFDEYLAKQKTVPNSKVMFISGTNTYERLLTLLITKRVDAILDDKAYIQYQMYRFPNQNNLHPSPSVISAGALSKGQHVVAYSPKHLEKATLLMAIIDPFVIDLYATGKIDKYLALYGLDYSL